jgi:hypothetical protein
VAVVRDDYRVGCNYITRENYEHLLASAERYAFLSGKELGHSPGSTPGEGIANLYRELSAMVGDDVNLNIETNDDRLVFVLWRYYRWGEYYFYWIPVKFLEELNPQLRRLAISFLHRFLRGNNLVTTNGSCDFEMMTEHFHERSRDTAEENPEELARLADEYCRDGRVGRLMGRIETGDYYKRLDLALDRYVPRSAYETRLVALVKRGLEFAGGGHPSIMTYAYDPLRDEKNEECYSVSPDRMIMLTYDVYSEIEAEARSYIQSEINEGYEIMVSATLVLTPDGDGIFTMDGYPSRFYEYLDDLLDFLTDGPQWTRMY